MSVTLSSAWYMSVEELLIVLHKIGLTDLPFPGEITGCSADGKALKLAMDRLIKDGILEDGSDGRFRFSDRAQAWIDILTGADETTVVYMREAKHIPEYIYNSGDKSLSLQMDRSHSGWVRLELKPLIDFAEYLTEDDRIFRIDRYRRNDKEPYESMEVENSGAG